MFSATGRGTWEVARDGDQPAGVRSSAYAGFLVQTVRKPAVLVHCHWVFSTSLVNGFGVVHPISRNKTAQASVEIATTAVICFRVHEVGVIAITPFTGALENRAA
jgi:hypothetical protein